MSTILVASTVEMRILTPYTVTVTHLYDFHCMGRKWIDPNFIANDLLISLARLLDHSSVS